MKALDKSCKEDDAWNAENDASNELLQEMRQETDRKIGKRTKISKLNKKSQKKRKEEAVRERARVSNAHLECATIKESDVNLMMDEEPKGVQQVKEIWDWKVVEAAVDTACVDHIVNPKDFEGLELIETPESKRGDSWTAAGGAAIPKLGEMKIPWRTDSGVTHGVIAKAGNVSKTLLSGDRLIEAGYDIILNKKNPRLVHQNTREVIQLERRNRMFIMKMWVYAKINKSVVDTAGFARPGKP